VSNDGALRPPLPQSGDADPARQGEIANPGAPLCKSKIEPRHKAVYIAPNFDRFNCPVSEKDYQAIADIRCRITNGESLDKYYRTTKNTDWLLVKHHVMHLHLGSPGSTALLYLIQYKTCVYFIEVNSHVHVDDVSAGKKLNVFLLAR
jgi:hypothetical protein